MRKFQDIRKAHRRIMVLLPSVVGAVLAVPLAHAAADINGNSLPHVATTPGTLNNILRITFGIIGAFALLSMTASGLKYITSGGDPQKTSEAKKGIIFALVGLMIAISAEAIVAFVVQRGAP